MTTRDCTQTYTSLTDATRHAQLPAIDSKNSQKSANPVLSPKEPGHADWEVEARQRRLDAFKQVFQEPFEVTDRLRTFNDPSCLALKSYRFPPLRWRYTPVRMHQTRE